MIFRRLFKKNPNNLKQELLDIVETKQDSEANDKDPELYLLNNIINIKNLKAMDILTPRVDIVSASENADMEELLNKITQHGFSRLPIYSDTLDNIKGFIHVKDLISVLRRENKLNITNIIRPVLFVSPYIKVLDLLFEMIAKSHHMSMVVDEFGGIDGLITIEDIIEELVGDISDEHDKFAKKPIITIDDNNLKADARLSLKELEMKVGDFLSTEEKEEVESVAGLVYFLSGRVPKKNEVIMHPSGVEITVLEGDPIKIKTVNINYSALNQNHKD